MRWATKLRLSAGHWRAGLRNAMLTATKGTAVLNTIFREYAAWCGDILTRENGSLVGHETGQVCLSFQQPRASMQLREAALDSISCSRVTAV